MNMIELNRSLVQLRLSGMPAVMETRLLQAQSENMVLIDLISTLVSDELACRSKRLVEWRHKQAQFRDAEKRLDNFDFQFNPKMNRSLSSIWLPRAGWAGVKMPCLSAYLGAVRATAPRPSGTPSSSRDTAGSIAKHMPCWKSWPRRSHTAEAFFITAKAGNKNVLASGSDGVD
jgi:hypothetical protein